MKRIVVGLSVVGALFAATSFAGSVWKQFVGTGMTKRDAEVEAKAVANAGCTNGNRILEWGSMSCSQKAPNRWSCRLDARCER